MYIHFMRNVDLEFVSHNVCVIWKSLSESPHLRYLWFISPGESLLPPKLWANMRRGPAEDRLKSNILSYEITNVLFCLWRYQSVISYYRNDLFLNFGCFLANLSSPKMFLWIISIPFVLQLNFATQPSGASVALVASRLKVGLKPRKENLMQSDESENIRHPTKNIESSIFRRKKWEAEGGLMIPNIGPGSHSEPGGLVHTGATWPTVHPTALRKKTKMFLRYT